MGYLHPVLVHFPIALLLLAVALEATGFFIRNERLAWTARLILLLGIVSTLFTFVCGNFAEIWAARSGISQEALEFHEFLATITSWLFVGLTAWRLWMNAQTRRFWRGLWILAATGACILLGFTGHYGAMLVYEHGAAIQGLSRRHPPSHEDLATLMQRQSAASIFYSNMMHNIFGWMVLVISVLLFLDMFAPKIGERARRFGPVLLLLGGLFLMIFSDQDSWPLYRVKPYLPITDNEVLLHKVYALLLILSGLYGLWVSRRATGSSPKLGGGARGGGDSPMCKAGGWRAQNRLIAIFALVGGALLFTHVHTVAPYANVAVGVYIHHTVMGFIALCIGAIKLLDDALPKPTKWRSLAYPALMGVMGVFLIKYNEGLPWFMGYGDYNPHPTRGGLVAPLGPYRAELVYHPEDARLELFVMARSSAQPVALPAKTLDLVVRVGDEGTHVPLACNPRGGERHAHFAGHADFLRGVPTFQVQAHAPINGRTYVADFEPWVDKTQAIAGPIAPYTCPMHPHIGSQNPGICPLCTMPLQPNRPPRPPGTLHDPAFQMELSCSPAAPTPKQRVRLTFTPRRTHNHKIVPLEVVHEQKLHLIIVSRDLSFFDHIHPVEQADGKFTQEYAFPEPGEYLLFVDVVPVGAANQVFRLPLTVSGTPPVAKPLKESLASGRLLDDYRIALTVSPQPIKTQDDVTLTFTLSKGGKPVTDLQPWLGAPGHCVLISEDTRHYLHSHPLEPPYAPPITGPLISFHTKFPHPGLYKVWPQFNHDGRILTADFVIRVP